MKVVLLDDAGTILCEILAAPTAIVGNIVEQLVVDKLRSLGHKAELLPLGSPVDMVVDGRVLVEVKAANSSMNMGSKCYPFGVKNHVSRVLILRTLDSDDFYIIPTDTLKVGTNRLYPRAKRWSRCKNNWSVIDSTWYELFTGHSL